MKRNMKYGIKLIFLTRQKKDSFMFIQSQDVRNGIEPFFFNEFLGMGW